MLRYVLRALERTLAFGAIGALIVGVPAAASQAQSAPPPWVAPTLLALAIVSAAVVTLRVVAPAERAVPGRSNRSLGQSRVQRRDAAVAGEATPVPTAARGAVPPPPGPVTAPGEGARAPGEVLRLLCARLDEVTYAPGAPNVLSMTKQLVDARPPAAATRLPVRCSGDGRGRIVVEVEGTLDVVTVAEVVPVLDAAAESQPRVVVLELSRLHRVDAAGVAALGRLAARVREHGGEVRALGLARQPRALFELLELGRSVTLS